MCLLLLRTAHGVCLLLWAAYSRVALPKQITLPSAVVGQQHRPDAKGHHLLPFGRALALVAGALLWARGVRLSPFVPDRDGSGGWGREIDLPAF